MKIKSNISLTFSSLTLFFWTCFDQNQFSLLVLFLCGIYSDKTVQILLILHPDEENEPPPLKELPLLPPPQKPPPTGCLRLLRFTWVPASLRCSMDVPWRSTALLAGFIQIHIINTYWFVHNPFTYFINYIMGL